MSIRHTLAACAVFAALTPLAHADISTYTGSSAAGPVFTRPLEDLSGLSAVGVGVRYSTFTFNVSTSGDYSFLSTAVFDNFNLLYAGVFNPATPLTNALVASDDLIAPPFTTSGFVASLTAGTNYTVVTTGFDPAEAGAFSNTIGGPGTVNVLTAPTPAASQIYTFTGNTTGGSTFTRPLEDLSGLSAVGVGVSYSAFHFKVTASGDYSFLNTAAFDNFSLLYEGAFNPLASLTNAIAASDDLLAPPFSTSGYAASLVAGTDYWLVTTGFDPLEAGFFSETIGGPGQIVAVDVTAVPEPETYALMLAGLGVLGWAARRRSA